MEKLLEKIALEKEINPDVVEDLLNIECKLVYKKKRHFRGDFNKIIADAVEMEVKNNDNKVHSI